MKVVSRTQGTDLLSELPSPPAYLGTSAKSHYRKLGKVLITSDRLKNIHLSALELMAENFAQWEWAVREIRRKNKKHAGMGYVQIYDSGAQNISVELTIKRDAEKAIMQCLKQFGLDPRSEKELKATVDPAQTDLFAEFMNKKTS